MVKLRATLGENGSKKGSWLKINETPLAPNRDSGRGELSDDSFQRKRDATSSLGCGKKNSYLNTEGGKGLDHGRSQNCTVDKAE